MDLNHLAIFAAVAEAASFSAAARKLGVPKSTVSRSIAALEESMRVELLHRTTRHVVLSSAGTALHDRVSPLLASLQKVAAERPSRDEEPSGELRVTTTTDFGALVLADIVTRFSQRYPSVRINLILTNQVVDLVAEGVDVALRFSTHPLKSSSLMARNLGPVSLQLFASPTYLARHGTPRSVRDLVSHDWVNAHRSAQLLRPAGVRKVPAQGRIICDDMFFVAAAVRAGAGIGYLPTYLAEPDVLSGQLVRVLPRWDLRSGSLWFVSPGARHIPRPPKLIAFRDFMIEALKVHPLTLRS